MNTIPGSDVDMFSGESVRNARAVDDALRELAPVVYLEREDIVVLGRHEHVQKGLADWRTFSSRSRPWHDPESVRPEILLTDDPPRHSEVRAVVADALSADVLAGMTRSFAAEADRLVRGIVERGDGEIDAVAAISRPFVYSVLPDLLGLPEQGREHMERFGHMVWATMGPENDLFREALECEQANEVFQWVDSCCERDNLDPDGLGMKMFEAADQGRITEAEAKLLVQILLSAAADTTVMTISTALRAFCEFPEQYRKLRTNPARIRAAFEESLRWDSPSRLAGRIATTDVDIEGITIPAGTRCGLLFATANRDPRKWPSPDNFDIERDLRGHVGWGYGVHACVGRMLAQMEAEALLGAVIAHVAGFESAGDPEPWMTTIGHGPARLPLRIRAA